MKFQKLITLFSTACLLLLSSLTFAQASSNTNAFGVGTNVINAGIGIGGTYSYIGPQFAQSPNFIVSYDYGIYAGAGPGIISLGGLFSYKSSSYNFDENTNSSYYDNTLSYYILGLRSAYHWNFTTSDQFDPYVGLTLAYYLTSFHTSDPYYNTYAAEPSYNSYLGLGFYIGARYYITPVVGIWFELGTGYSNAAIGASFKF